MPTTYKTPIPNKSYACGDCEYYKAHRCKLWQVKVSEPDDSYCESLKIR